MKKKRILFLLVSMIFLVASTQGALADEVRLKNGDRITGKVVSMQDGSLVFETGFAGQITIQWSEVERLLADDSQKVVLTDGTTTEGSLQAAGAGRMRLQVGSLAQSVEVAPADIAAINPAEKPPVKLSGRVNVGFQKSTGNTDNQRIHLDAEAVARTEKNRFTVGGEYNRAKEDDEKSEDNALGYLKYDHFLTPKWYVYTNGFFETDEFKDINLRTTLGAGVGYQVFEGELMNLSLEAGPSWVSTDYEESEDEDYAAGRWAVNFDRFFFDKLFQYYLKNEGYFRLETPADMFMLTRTGLRFPVRAGLTLNAGFEWDYDNEPEGESEKSDYRYILSLGYGF